MNRLQPLNNFLLAAVMYTIFEGHTISNDLQLEFCNDKIICFLADQDQNVCIR